MRRLHIVALLAVTTGAGLLLVGRETGRVANFLPFQAPFPSAGHEVGGSFRLTRGGRFMIQVVTPATATERMTLHREQPPVTCNIAVVVTGPNGVRLNQKITSLHNGGWTKDANLFMPAETMNLPSRGKYTVSVFSRVPVDLFHRRGARIQLSRFEPVGAEMLGSIFNAFGYVFLGIAVALMIRARRRA